MIRKRLEIVLENIKADEEVSKLQKFKLRAPYWEGRERLVN